MEMDIGSRNSSVGSRNSSVRLGFGIVCVGLFMRMRFGVGSAFVMLSHGCATTTAIQFNSYG